MEILYKGKLEKIISRIVIQCMQGGLSVFVSPYISDFKPWGNLRGAKIKEGKNYLTELFVSGTLEEDNRIILITDKDSKNRRYSRGIIREINKRNDTFWIFIFEIENLHAKLFLNNKIAIIGSSNLTYKALKKNIELGTLVTNHDGNIINDLKVFIGDLIINSTPLSGGAKMLKDNLKKQKLLKKEIIFNIVELISWSHYLYWTTKIMCAQESFKEPIILKQLGDLLNRFDTHAKKVEQYAKTFPVHIYTNSQEDLVHKQWEKEEFKIKQRKIDDILEVWDKYFLGKISKPVDFHSLFIKDYKNPVISPKVATLDYDEQEASKFTAELIEERIKKMKSE